uniref:T9SS type A sorting domain-containing protein n=1 Tax=candidate division WOR-3 bacterium TaxID=2052148 RepID=A0A7V3RH40_UNCW3
MKKFTSTFLFIFFLNLFLSFFYLSSVDCYLPSVISNYSLFADTLIYWEPEQRLTYDTIPQLHCQVWAYDSFVHILVNYDFPAMYLRSSDYGQTWSDAVQLNVESSANFQSLTQQDSVVYFTWSEHRVGPPFGKTQVDTHYVFFRRSNNNGATLDSAIFLGKGWPVSIDAKKESVFVNPVVCEPPPVLGPYLLYSFYGGLNWSEYLPIVDSASQPNIAYRNGVLHFSGVRNYKIIYTRSTNFGTSWSTPTVITAPNTVLPKRPVLALGPNQDVYIAWTDNKYSGAMQFDDVLFRKSTDDGLTWGPEQRLTPDSHCDAGGALDMVSQDSMIFIVWCYNGIGYPAPCSLFILVSTNCGESWRGREVLASGSGYPINDANVAISQNFVYVIWRDNRYYNGGEIFLRRGSFMAPGIKERRNDVASRISIFPNPFSQEIRIGYRMQDKGYRKEDFSIKIFDVLGKKVMFYGSVKDGGIIIDTKGLPGGVYFVMVKAGGVNVIKKVVKVR